MRMYSRGAREQRKAWSRNAHAAKARKRMEGPPPDWQPRKVPAGELLGVLQWHAACGDVHRITVRQGARANRIRIPGCRKDHGFDWLMRKLREKLAVPRRITSAAPTESEES